MNGSNLSRQRLLLIFYVVTFGISWCGVAIAVSYGGIPRDAAQMARMIPVLVLAMLAGPALASILFTRIAGGRMAYSDLLSALICWRVPMGWYTAALLTAPLVLMTVPCALSLRFPNFLPRILTVHNKGQILLMGFIVGSIAAFFEELGWTGFVPRLRLTLGSFSTAFIVGVLSGAWHLPVNILSCVTQAGISVSSLVGTLIFSLGLLPAYRILMVRVWDRSGSLLLAMLMHLTLTASNIILGPAVTPGTMAITFNLALAGAMWIVAAATVVASRSHHSVVCGT